MFHTSKRIYVKQSLHWATPRHPTVHVVPTMYCAIPNYPIAPNPKKILGNTGFPLIMSYFRHTRFLSFRSLQETFLATPALLKFHHVLHNNLISNFTPPNPLKKLPATPGSQDRHNSPCFPPFRVSELHKRILRARYACAYPVFFKCDFWFLPVCKLLLQVSDA